MKKLNITEGDKTCELIIFEKYEHSYPKNEFKRIGKLIDFREIDRNGFDIHSNIHSGFNKWSEKKFTDRINSDNRLELDSDEIKNLVRSVYKKYNSLFLCNFMRIFIYPWETERKTSDMSGVWAFSPFKNTLHLWINPKNSKWKNVVKETIFHEQSHAYLYNHNKIFLLLGYEFNAPLHIWMISEGLAENYAESVTGGIIWKGKFKHKWFGFTKKECHDIFKTLGKKIKMKVTDENYREMALIMFGNGNYKRLTGYAIGYWIVSDYMTKNNVDIKSAHHKSFDEILKGSGWLDLR